MSGSGIEDVLPVVHRPASPFPLLSCSRRELNVGLIKEKQLRARLELKKISAKVQEQRRRVAGKVQQQLDGIQKASRELQEQARGPCAERRSAQGGPLIRSKTVLFLLLLLLPCSSLTMWSWWPSS